MDSQLASEAAKTSVTIIKNSICEIKHTLVEVIPEYRDAMYEGQDDGYGH